VLKESEAYNGIKPIILNITNFDTDLSNETIYPRFAEYPPYSLK